MIGLDVEAVLGRHSFTGHGYRSECRCGWVEDDTPFPDTDHTAHVAAILRVEIETALGDAWDEGRQAGITSAVDCRFATPNPYRASLAATEGDRQ